MSDGVALAQRYLELNRPGEAATRIAAHLAAEPDDVQALCLSALIALRNRDHAGAERAARRAASLAPDSDWAMRLLSIALAHRGRAAEALRAADRAVELNPTAWETHANRANVGVQVRKVDRTALRAAQQAVSIRPDVPDTHDALGRVQLQMRGGGEARESFARALRIDPTDDAARRGLALLSVRRFAPWRVWRSSREELGRNPDAREAATLLRLAAHRTIWVAGITVAICARVGAIALQPAAEAGVESSGALPAVLLSVVLALVGGWLGLTIARSGGGWAAVRGTVRVHRVLRWWAAMFAVSLLLMAAATVLPASGARTAYGCAMFLAVGGSWLSLLGLRRERKRGRRP